MKRVSGRRVLISADAVGGVWQYATEIARGLAGAGLEPIIANLGPEPTARRRADVLRIEGVRLLDLKAPLDWTARSPAALDAAAEAVAAAAAEVGAEIVHLNAPALACSRYKVPTLVVAHSCVATWWHAVRGGSLPPDFEWRRERVARGLAAATLVVAPSDSFAADLAAEYGARTIRVIHNGRNRIGVAPVVKERIVFTAGRLWDEGKNVGILDAAAAAITAPVVAAGETRGPNGAAVALKHLRTLGPLEEQALAAWYGRAAIFVSLSRYEPFGLAPLEAAQAGAALILSDIPTFRELWDGAACFVAATDPAAVANAVEHLLRDSAALGAAAKAARKRASRYTAARMVERTLAAYQSILDDTVRKAA